MRGLDGKSPTLLHGPGKLRTALSGYGIDLYGPKGERDWAAALDEAIL